MNTTPHPHTGDTATNHLVVDFAGEIHDVAPGEEFTVGRTGSLEIDDNPYLHRTFLHVEHRQGLWWISNVGTHLPAFMTDAGGLVRTTLAPGATQPLVFASTMVTFMAGGTSYEIDFAQNAAVYEAVTAEELDQDTEDDDLTIGPSGFTESQLLAILALAEPALKRAGTGLGHVPTAVDAARRLGWTQTRFNRKLDNVCQKLDDAGVAGLRGGPGAQASQRRATLVDYAVSTRLVTAEDLTKLDAESARNRTLGTPPRRG